MSNARFLVSTIIGAALLAPALAMANGYTVSNGEAGIIFRDTPSTITRAQVLSELKSGKAISGGWKYVGGEAGWTLEQAKFVFQNGQLVHASDCTLRFAAATPPAERAGAGKDIPSFYKGA